MITKALTAKVIKLDRVITRNLKERISIFRFQLYKASSENKIEENYLNKNKIKQDIAKYQLRNSPVAQLENQAISCEILLTVSSTMI